MSSQPSLDAWRTSFQDAERSCPWPGPRPLTEADARGLLVGREDDIRQFTSSVELHPLVLLSGDSGVGKSSLLEVGLAPKLRAQGKFVAVCRDWSASEEKPAGTFLAEKVHDELKRYLPDLPRDGRIFGELQNTLGQRCVIILDQFEELVRDAPGFAESIFDVILRLNESTNLHLVVSLRSEYLHRLDRLETESQNFSLGHCRLKAIDPMWAKDVITAPETFADVMTDDDAKELARRWTEARNATVHASNDPFGRVGLLHLQALLYALHGRSSDGRVTLAMADKLGGSAPQDLFIAGLMDSIDLKLERCQDACDDIGVDAYLVQGSRQILASAVRHLASDGFKLVRGVSDLATSALGADLENLDLGLSRAGEVRDEDGSVQDGDGPCTEAQHRELLRAVLDVALNPRSDGGTDLITASRSSLAKAADALHRDSAHVLPWAKRLHPGADPWVADPAEVTCGPMSGMAPAAVLVEELRRYAFALTWLRDSSLVRISSPGEAGSKVSLIHDGFGEALARWSAREMDGPTAPLHALTAPRGASFAWQFDPDAPPLSDLDGGATIEGQPVAPKLLLNLRWKGGYVRANFRNVAFVNCDLRGLLVDRCVLEGVTFVNCLLDGMILSDCWIRGASNLASGDYFDEPVAFEVETTDRVTLDTFAKYRGIRSNTALQSFSSPADSAFPAVPVSDGAGVETWVPEPGGVTIYGGRVSGFLLRNCRFDRVPATGLLSMLSLRRTSGSGFDVVEQTGGRVEIFASALRHLTFTTGPRGTIEGFDITALGSAMAQIWIGDQVEGRFVIRKGLIAHLWNGSPGMELEVHTSPFLGVVNAESIEDSSPINPGGSALPLESADPEELIREKGRLMDYRRNSAFR